MSKSNASASLKFSGNRSLKEIKSNVLARGWPWDQSRHDGGGDYVTFGFMSGRKKVSVVYNTFNGGFIAKSNGQLITHESTDMDAVKWYRDLLDFIYSPAKQIEEAS